MKIKVTFPLSTMASVEIEVPDDMHNPPYVAREFVEAAIKARQRLPFTIGDWAPDISHSWQIETEPSWHAKPEKPVTIEEVAEAL